MSLALGFLIVLLVGLIGGIFAKKFRQPLILGYLVSGILFGSLPLFPINKEDLLSLAQMGIALLMFSVGTELSLGSLAQVKKLVAVGALIQVFLITILIGAILSFFGFSLPASLFLGFCFSLSSTAVITKILFDQGNEGTFTAEVMVGWLLFQDLLTLAVMALLPSFSPDANLVLTSSLADLMRAGGFILACFFLGKKFFPRIINQIANLSSREILLLATLALCFGLALLGSLFGLSLAMGAFLAGLIISPILSSRAMFAEIRPVRDILAVIFFVLLGMTVNLSFLFQNLGLSVVVSLAVIFLKFLLVFVIILLFGNHLRVAFTAALALSLPAGGEFAFILAVAGATLGVIENSQFSLVVAVAILTMLATPVILARTAPLYRRFRHTVKPWLNRFGRACDDVSLAAPALEEEGLPIENHVVILGFGRVGAWVGRALQMAKIPYLVVDYNQRVARDLKRRGVNVVYGDPAELPVLDYAQVDRARLVVVAIPDRETQRSAIANSLTLNPKVLIICRSHHFEDTSDLKTLGAKFVIQPEFEAALSIIHRIFQNFDLDKEEISQRMKSIKREHGI